MSNKVPNIFFAKAENGELNFSNKKVIRDFLSSINKKDVWVRIERMTGKRSDNQNSFYWMYLTVIANETGHTENDLHELFKRIFLPPEYKKILGREIKMPATTTKLDKNEFSEYLDRICAETNVPIPDSKLFIKE